MTTRMKSKKPANGHALENGSALGGDTPTLVDHVDREETSPILTEKQEPHFERSSDTQPDGHVATERRDEVHAGASEVKGDPEPEAEGNPEPERNPEPEPDGAPEPEPEVEQARELSHAHLRGLLEALVFASDKPMKHTELARLASAPPKQVKELLAELRATYSTRGIVLDEIAGGWLFRTNAQYAPFVRELAGGRPVRLSRAQIETLAIAAYRQPITRPEIDEIRGVDSGATLKLLLERDLVRILGKKDEPGRPLLYGTTTHFLEFFNMKSLKDLPTLREFTELSDESLRIAEAELEGTSGAPTLRADVGAGHREAAPEPASADATLEQRALPEDASPEPALPEQPFPEPVATDPSPFEKEDEDEETDAAGEEDKRDTLFDP